MTPQEKMDAAVDNYLEVAEILSSDVNDILGQETETAAWKRAYIRAVSAMIVGDNNSIQQMTAIGLETDSPILTSKEVKALSSENQNSAADQVKYVLRAAYKMFELEQSPDFSENGWVLAQKFMEKRSAIMHPKCAADLDIADNEWDDLFEGSKWLITEHFALIERMHAKYSDGS